jgi:hypothetical protein|tara:strand:+ start:16142 stop:17215 length:1074 start_codon:yes stop_codon:yes gene_type:complete
LANIVGECNEKVNHHIKNISEEIKPFTSIFNELFVFDKILISENGGKTKLNRQILNDHHDLMQNKILLIISELDQALDAVKEYMKLLLLECNKSSQIETVNLIYDDKNFLDLLEMDLDTKVIPATSKKKLLKDIQTLSNIKNKIFNLKYLVTMFDTTIVDKYLNKLGVEDLINSTFIFELIDTFGLHFEELKKFEYTIANFNKTNEKVKDFSSLNYLLELHKRRADNYIYANFRYKISLDYNLDLNLNKKVDINILYLENIISSFIEQSCMDLVKKEMKKGKINKLVEVNIFVHKKNIQLVVKNNGFEVKNIHTLFISDTENKYIIEAKNLANMLGATMEVTSMEDEGMAYTCSFKI